MNKVELMRAKKDKKFMQKMKDQANKLMKEKGIKWEDLRKHPEMYDELLNMVSSSLKHQMGLDPNIEYDQEEAKKIVKGEKVINFKK